MGWPQLTLLAMWTIGIGVHLAKHGEPIKGYKGDLPRYNWIVRTLATGIWVWLLWMGGFFNGMGP